MSDLPSLIADLVEQYLPRFCRETPLAESRDRLKQRFGACIAHHREKFRAAEIQNVGQVVEYLQEQLLIHKGKLRQVESDVLEDVALALCFCDNEPIAIREFLNRFYLKAEALARAKCQSVRGKHYAEELDVYRLFSEIRPRAGNKRLDVYKGRTVLWVFVSMCIKNDFLDWRKKTIKQSAQTSGIPLDEIESGRRLDTSDNDDHQLTTDESRQAISELFDDVLNQLTEEQQFILQAKSHGASNVEIAHILQRNSAHIGRVIKNFLEILPGLILEQVSSHKSPRVRDYLKDSIMRRPEIRGIFLESAGEWLKKLNMKLEDEKQS